MSNLKIFGLMMIVICMLCACNTTTGGPSTSLDGSSIIRKDSLKEKQQVSDYFTTLFTDIFETEKKESNGDLLIPETKILDVNVKPEFKEFNSKNAVVNLKLSIDSNPRVKATLGKLKSYEAEIDAMRAVKALTSKIQAVGGLESENRSTKSAAGVILSTQKLLYDARSADLRIESKTYQRKSGEISVLVSADLVALDALKAWIDLVRFKRVNKLFSDGFERTQPLLDQIKSVSTSGLTDKKSLLVSQRQIMELQDRFLAAQSMRKVSEEIFLDSFPGANLSTVVDAPRIKIDANDVFGSYDLENVPSIREKLLLMDALKLNMAGLEASNSPQVAFRASVNAPMDNTLDDGVANAGFNLTYDFNDGGSRAAQVAQVKAELDILRSEIGDLKNKLKVEYSKNAINYETSLDRIDALSNLIEISKEIKETARQQLLSGRSTIKDVLDAEVTLSSLKIDQANAEADILITLITAKAYKDGLTQMIGWSY
ncbi:MAG: hypothetical protein CML40_06375 [Rhodobacteraceae bacterium]|nr:MAG: hypothetical protein CML40_06375 [Paracoccaceae bacterium]